MLPTVVELHRTARELQIPGHWRMNKAELEKATGYKAKVPPHLPFLVLLAMDHERYATSLADKIRAWKYQISTYDYESPRLEQLRLWLRTAELDLVDACQTAAHYRKQAGAPWQS